MTVKRNDASGGANGTNVTVANSGTATADGFTTVFTQGGATVTYDTKESVKSIKFEGKYGTPAQGGGTTPMAATVSWTLATATRVSGRIEMWLPSPGPYDNAFQTNGFGTGVVWVLARLIGSFNAAITMLDRVSNSGAGSNTRNWLRVQAGGKTLFFDPDVITFNQWFRIEYDFVTTNPDGRYTIKVYPDRYTTTPSHQWSTALTWTSPGTVSEVRLGADSSITDSMTTPVAYWMTGLYVADDGTLPTPATPPADPKMSSLTDAFTTLNTTTKWSASGSFAVNTLPSGASRLVVQSATATLASRSVYDPDRASVAALLPDNAIASIDIKQFGGDDFASMLVDTRGTSDIIRAQWKLGTVTGSTTEAGKDRRYDAVNQPYIRIDRVATTVTQTLLLFSTSPDGSNWDLFASVDAGTRLARTTVEISGTTNVAFKNFNIGADLNPPKDSLNSKDPYDPGAASPVEGDPYNTMPICDTVLNLIRKFSTEVKRAVRIVDANTIEMVDPYLPLPAGFGLTDGPSMYHSYSRKLTAGTKTLSVLRGDVQGELSGELIADDMRTALSGLRLPNIYPVPELSVAPVRRLTLTFTPHQASGTVEFHVRDVPLDIR